MRDLGHDITPLQFAVLCSLEIEKGIDQISLAKAVAYDPVTISGVIDRLEKKHYLRRETNPADRRSKLVHLTETGSLLLKVIQPEAEALQSKITSNLNAEETEHLKALLYKATREQS
jgi:DNA-binding MarR family transcriptional regulator